MPFNASKKYYHHIKINMNKYAITIDVDWAPDFTIEEISKILTAQKVKCTWFVTHDSPAIQQLSKNPLFELGIHPNFFPGSSHGKDEDEIISYCLDLVPNAKCVRTHALYQSSRLLRKLREKYNLLIDSSIYLPYATNINPHKVYFSHDAMPIIRIPYFWEDDLECYRKDKTWDFNNPKFEVTGLKIFNFHPTYIYLNIDEMHSYENLKKEVCVSKPLNEVVRSEMDVYKNSKLGVGTFFNQVIEFINRNRKESYTLSEIAI
jgi:hypothetical protein